MIVVSIWVESGCSFNEGEYNKTIEGVIHDSLNLDIDPELIDDCISKYDGNIKPEILYTFFLHRANIATAFPGYEPAFDIWQVIKNIDKINIQL